MIEQEEYAELAGEELEAIYPDFERLQEIAANNIFEQLLPFIQRGEIKTLIDVGCGSGEILSRLHNLIAGEINSGSISTAMPSKILLIGIDSTSAQIDRALQQPLTSTEYCRTLFVACEGSRSFLDELSDGDYLPGRKSSPSLAETMESTAVICISHTIFHLLYLNDVFAQLDGSPSERPRLWLLDIYHSWDQVLETLSRQEEVLEPRNIRVRPDGARVADTLFTRNCDRADTVERGLHEISCGAGIDLRNKIVTRQLRWNTNETRNKFFRCGYMLNDKSSNRRGWGMMDTYLFTRPSTCATVAELFLGRMEPQDGLAERDSEELFKDAPIQSPMKLINRRIVQSDTVLLKERNSAEWEGKGNFDFVLIEYVPWYDLWQGQDQLDQEILLRKRSDVLDTNLAKLIAIYNGLAKSLQDNDLGLFLHPYMKGADSIPDEWGRITTSYLPAAADGVSYVHGDKNWRREKYNTVHRYTALGSTDAEPVEETGGASLYRRTKFERFGVDKNASKLAERILRDHGSKSADAIREDYLWTLELFHSSLRQAFDLEKSHTDVRTFLISAPLRLTLPVATPDSYRGGVWIFAGTRDQYGRRLTKTMTSLLKECLLVGSAAVEASASESAREGIHHNAARVAAAAIMSRNMSHNIGSNPIAQEIKRLQRAIAPSPVHDQPAMADYRQLVFLTYLRDRMDYLAEITTANPTWGAAFRLGNICADFNGQKVLLRGLTRAPDSKLEVGKSCENLQVFMPHGTLGVQALNTIFENLIRNSVQHGQPAKDARLGVLRVEAASHGDCVELTLIDLGQPKPPNEAEAQQMLAELRGKFESPLYGMDEPIGSEASESSMGQLNPHNWGLKEMKISAAFLRLRPGWLVDKAADTEGGTTGYKETENHAWVQPDWAEEGGRAYLSHRVLLLKPKLGVVVGSSEIFQTARADQDKAGAIGLDFDTPEEFLNRVRANPVPHPYILIHHSNYASLVENLRKSGCQSRVSIRILRIGDTTGDREHDVGWTELRSALDCDAPATSVALLLAKAWNRRLASYAIPGGEVVLVLATASKDKLDSLPTYDGRVLWAAETELSRSGGPRLASHGRIVAYERHANHPGGLYHEDNLGVLERRCCWSVEPCQIHREFWDKVQAYVGIRSGQDVSVFDSIQESDSLAVERLIEAGLIWVVVVDERVSKYFKRQPAERMQLARSGIIVLPFVDEANIAKEELGADRVTAFLQENLGQSAGRPGLVLFTVHLSLLKGSGRANDLGWFDELRQKLNRVLDGVPIDLMVHSGRGLPPELRNLPDVRFVEFSNLDTFVQRPTDKPQLVDVLLSVRRHGGGTEK